MGGGGQQWRGKEASEYFQGERHDCDEVDGRDRGRTEELPQANDPERKGRVFLKGLSCRVPCVEIPDFRQEEGWNTRGVCAPSSLRRASVKRQPECSSGEEDAN